MKQGSLWFDDHHWHTTDQQKTNWKIVLQHALIAVLVFLVIMFLFPSLTY